MLDSLISLYQDDKDSIMSWDEYFMCIALVSSRRSKDPNKKVGCCIVNKENKILSIGYNGFPRGCSDCKLPWTKTGDWKDTKYPYVVHAEANAILNATSNLRDSIAYVTLFPCNECAKLMIQAGITKVYYLNDTQGKEKDAAVLLFNMVNVECSQIEVKNN